MISAIALRIISRASRQLAAGDIRPLVRTYRIDAIDTFPEQGSWAGVYRGRAEIGAFLRRFADVGLKLQPVDVVAKGWPWNMTVCVCSPITSPRRKASACTRTVACCT
jgi:hypothetical protein